MQYWQGIKALNLKWNTLVAAEAKISFGMAFLLLFFCCRRALFFPLQNGDVLGIIYVITFPCKKLVDEVLVFHR